jgi:hypothetical protein
VSLIANGLIALCLILRFSASGLDVEATPAAFVRALGPTVAGVLGILAAKSLFVGSLRKREHAATLEDERDVQIHSQAGLVSHGVLLTLLLIFSVQLVFGGVMQPLLSPLEALGLESPVAIAHVLLFLVIVSQGSRWAAAIWLYRRS